MSWENITVWYFETPLDKIFINVLQLRGYNMKSTVETNILFPKGSLTWTQKAVKKKILILLECTMRTCLDIILVTLHEYIDQSCAI